MKLILLSDTHIRLTSPVGRKESFYEEQFKKWEYIFSVFENEKIDAILQAGDFWDNPRPPYSLVNQYIAMAEWYNVKPIYFIYGQHDMLMRNTDIYSSVAGLMDNIGKATLIDESGLSIDSGVKIYGVSFGGDYDKLKKNVVTDSNIFFKILIVHDMIGNRPLFPGHEYTEAFDFLDKWKEFNVILCGDYHYPFHIISKDGRHIVNTGCLLRLSRDERDMDRIPHFWIVDTDLNDWKKVNIPCESKEKIFISQKSLSDSMPRSDVLFKFIEKLKKKEKMGVDYINVLAEFYKYNKVSDEIKDLINEVLLKEM